MKVQNKREKNTQLKRIYFPLLRKNSNPFFFSFSFHIRKKLPFFPKYIIANIHTEKVIHIYPTSFFSFSFSFFAEMPCEHFTTATSGIISQTVECFQTKILNPTKWACKVCQVSCDIYVCLFCGTFLCGSQVQSHSNAHFLETSHSLFIHINSLSCYW